MARKIKPAWNLESDYSEFDYNDRMKTVCLDRAILMLGIEQDADFEPIDDPWLSIEHALFIYCCESKSPERHTSSERKEVFHEWLRRAKALNDAIKNTGNSSYLELSYGLRDSLGIEPRKFKENFGLGEEKIERDPRQDDFFDYINKFDEFCQTLESAIAAINYPSDNIRKGRKPNTPLQHLIFRLSQVYQEKTGRNPYSNFRYDDLDEKYRGPIYNFIFEILNQYDSDAVGSNNALGKQIRNVLAPKS